MGNEWVAAQNAALNADFTKHVESHVFFSRNS